MIPDDVDNKGVGDDDNVYTPLLGNSTSGIVIWNDPSTHMLSVDPNAVHVFEFLKYPNIIPSHRLASNLKSEELVVC